MEFLRIIAVGGLFVFVSIIATILVIALAPMIFNTLIGLGIGYGIGWLIDNIFNTHPIFTNICMVIGGVVSFFGSIGGGISIDDY